VQLERSGHKGGKRKKSPSSKRGNSNAGNKKGTRGAARKKKNRKDEKKTSLWNSKKGHPLLAGRGTEQVAQGKKATGSKEGAKKKKKSRL